MYDKKVLLRERKRHTARHVASTPYVVLSWLTPSLPPPPPRWTETPPPHLDWPPPPWTDRQTHVKTLPSRRTTYAGGKDIVLPFEIRKDDTNVIAISNGDTVLLFPNGWGKQALLKLLLLISLWCSFQPVNVKIELVSKQTGNFICGYGSLTITRAEIVL